MFSSQLEPTLANKLFRMFQLRLWNSSWILKKQFVKEVERFN